MTQGINKQVVKIVQAVTLGELETEINKAMHRVSNLYTLKDCRVTKMEVGAFATLIFEETPEEDDGVEISDSAAKARSI